MIFDSLGWKNRQAGTPKTYITRPPMHRRGASDQFRWLQVDRSMSSASHLLRISFFGSLFLGIRYAPFLEGPALAAAFALVGDAMLLGPLVPCVMA